MCPNSGQSLCRFDQLEKLSIVDELCDLRSFPILTTTFTIETSTPFFRSQVLTDEATVECSCWLLVHQDGNLETLISPPY